MEESITILEAIKRDFGCGEIDIRTYSPLTLAYIGDAIYDVVVEYRDFRYNEITKAKEDFI